MAGKTKSPSCLHDATSIVCQGTCRKSFHAVCVGLSGPDVQLLTSIPNVVWMCDDCRDTFLADHGKPPAGPRIFSNSAVDQLRSRGLQLVKLSATLPRSRSKCDLPACIFSNLTIICEKSCSKAFHVMCVGLLDVDLSVISSSDNIMWFCEGCRRNGLREPQEESPQCVKAEEATWWQDCQIVCMGRVTHFCWPAGPHYLVALPF